MENNRDIYFDENLEVAVLSAIMHRPHLINDLGEYREEVFYTTRNQELFKLMKTHIDKNRRFDLVVFLQEIKMASPKYLSITFATEVFNSYITENFDLQLATVLELFQKRTISQELKTLDFTQGAIELKSSLMSLVNKVEIKDDEEDDVQDVLFSRLNEITSKKVPNGIKTGYVSIDKNLFGFNGGELITISARSGVGKTTWAINIFLNQIFNNTKACYFSLEVPKAEIINKMLSMMTGVENHKIRGNNCSDEEEMQIAGAVNTLASKKFKIFDKKCNVDYIITKIREEYFKGNLEIAYIDLINRVTTRESKNGTRAEQIGTVTRALKQLAMELNIPIVILAQINREAMKRADSRPQLHDLKESGSIEEDSDVCFGLYRNLQLSDANYRAMLSASGKLDYNSSDADKNPEVIELLTLKGRYTGNSSVSLKYVAKTGRIK